jgi:diguanylate cyclase (GGDEF)-like protein
LSEIQDLQSRLQELAIRDSLTGLYNRRYLMETLDRELSRAARDRVPLSLVMIDIDHFKQVNDQFGHKAGDMVLQALSILFSSKTRRMDIACRYGGDEFFVVLPGANLDCACKRAEEWRSEFEELRIHYGDLPVGTTFSAGVAEFHVHGETME